ncbi:MAG TPA: D-alanyl-D-alanine carboxypeptidase/D-alanyl-D-alanine-endopeptidase [Gemmatimonadales bacterium]|nr:D-alanyl-D-alanine carboxypeptidase/D-alanyl-D-alanine-endopeptidase [Gemmatimonadales bacterium]
MRSRVALTLALAPAVLPVRATAQFLPAEVAQSLDVWYGRATRVAPGNWGIAITTADGRLLWAVNPNQPLAPASTAKIFTTGFARSVLGGQARIPTRVLGHGYVDPSTGAWIGPWALELNGDPTLDRAARSGPSLRQLATQLRAMGIRELRGGLALQSATGTTATAVPAAWGDRYPGQLYAPPIGAVALHENVVSLMVRPGRELDGAPELVWAIPAGWQALVRMDARTVDGAASRLRLDQTVDGGWVLSGTIGRWARPTGFASIAARPELVLEHAWAAALERAGIQWARDPVVLPAAVRPLVPIAQVTSAPLDTLASEVNRRSVNIGAEMLLRWAARGEGAGAGERLSAHVRAIVGPMARVRLADGSGLSPRDSVSPLTQALYLARAPRAANLAPLPLLLPKNGTGTLRGLGRGVLAPGVVRAKTGTLDSVAALAGYLGRREGVVIVSAIYNGARTRPAKRAQWELFRLLGANGVDLATAASQAQLGGDDAGRR